MNSTKETHELSLSRTNAICTNCSTCFLIPVNSVWDIRYRPCLISLALPSAQSPSFHWFASEKAPWIILRKTRRITLKQLQKIQRSCLIYQYDQHFNHAIKHKHWVPILVVIHERSIDFFRWVCWHVRCIHFLSV